MSSCCVALSLKNPMCVTHSHLALPLQLLEEVVRLELFLLLLVRQHAGDLEVDPRYLVLKHAQIVAFGAYFSSPCAFIES